MCLLFSCWNPQKRGPSRKSSWTGVGGWSDSKCQRNKLATLNQGEKEWDGVSLALTLSLMCTLKSECFHQFRLSSHPTRMWTSQTVYCLMAKRLDTFSGRLQKFRGPACWGCNGKVARETYWLPESLQTTGGGGFQFTVQKGIPAQGLGTCPFWGLLGMFAGIFPFD